MARTIEEIKAKIAELEAYRDREDSYIFRDSCRSMISHLKGELMLAKEAGRERAAKVGHIEDSDTGGCIDFEYGE